MPRMNGLTDTLKDQPKKFASTQKDQKNLDNVLQTLLEITGGKDFQIHDKTIQNVFISCRFLGSGDLLSSQVIFSFLYFGIILKSLHAQFQWILFSKFIKDILYRYSNHFRYVGT